MRLRYTEREYATEPLGGLKIFAIRKTENNTGVEGWFYPMFVTKEEAIATDIEQGGQGLYHTIKFYDRFGEFYYADSFNYLEQTEEPLVYTLYEGAGAENPFERIKNRLSVLVPNQLPSFVQSDYPEFISFLKAYYEFMEQNNKAQEIISNLRSYKDIDTTSEDLVNHFLSTYAEDYTLSEISDNSFIIKRIRDIYRAKGTDQAYRTLFYILYKETVDFFYPKNYILKTSDGKWRRLFTLRVKPVNTLQNIYDFENTLIEGQTSKAKAIVTNVVKYNLGQYDIYELQLDSNSIEGNFQKEEILVATKLNFYDGEITNTISIRAYLYSIVSKILVLDGALGYEEGSRVHIQDVQNQGNYAIAEIGGVNSFGSIAYINVVDPGVNYSNSVIVDPDLPTQILEGKYSLKLGIVTIEFPFPHGMEIGALVDVAFHSNTTSPINGTNTTARITSIPNNRTIKFLHPEADNPIPY